MIETKAWKKLRGLESTDQCRLCGKHRETVQHILAGCTLLANHEYLKRHNHVLSIFAIEWCKVNGLIDENERWYNFNWKTGQVIEGKGKKVLWDFEFAARKTNK